MKRTMYLITAIALLSSCRKHYISPCCVPFLGAPEAEITAQRNDTVYQTLRVYATLKNDSVTITSGGLYGVYKTNFLADSIYVRFKFNGKGTYHISGDEAGYATIIADRIPILPNSPTTWYQLNTFANNAFIITDYDESKDRIIGNFELHFSLSNHPDVNFLSGDFFAPLKK